MHSPPAAGLARHINRWDLVAAGINIVIGAGIFGLPARIYALAGAASPLAYLICGVAVLLIVLCFAEVGSRFAVSGGPYLFAREAFGDVVGFQVGWLRWLSGTVTFAANSNLLVDYLDFLFAGVGTGASRLIAISVLIASITFVNVIGVRSTTVAGNWLTIGKLLPLVLFAVVGLGFIAPERFAMHPLPEYDDFSKAVLFVMYAFMGFEAITVPAAEVRDPGRNMPFALFTSMGIVAILYIAIQVICIGSLPNLASSTRPLADASAQFVGSAGAGVIAFGAILSIAGQLTVQLLAISRLLFAMAEHRQLPPIVTAIRTRGHTPYFAIGITTAMIFALAVSGTFVQLATIGVLTRLIVYATTCAALPALRRRPDLGAPAFRLTLGSWIAILGVTICVWMLTNTTLNEIIILGGAAGAGLAVQLLNFLHRRPAAKRSTL